MEARQGHLGVPCKDMKEEIYSHKSEKLQEGVLHPFCSWLEC